MVIFITSRIERRLAVLFFGEDARNIICIHISIRIICFYANISLVLAVLIVFVVIMLSMTGLTPGQNLDVLLSGLREDPRYIICIRASMFFFI